MGLSTSLSLYHGWDMNVPSMIQTNLFLYFIAQTRIFLSDMLMQEGTRRYCLNNTSVQDVEGRYYITYKYLLPM